MRKVHRAGLSIAGFVMLAMGVWQCGDSDVRITTGGVNPTPGTFTGLTGQGGEILIRVGSIEFISFECDGEIISETFSPPRRVNSDGTFDVGFSDGGREFDVEGQFLDNNTVRGDIDDEENDCDTSFEAFRSGVVPTTVRTPTPGGPTPTGGGPTPTGDGGPTPTDGGPTPTGGGGPTATPTNVGPSPCPDRVTLEGQGAQADLDTGWTGIAFDQTVIGKGSLTVGLDCPGPQRGQCGNCTVSGPIASTTSVNNERCISDTSIECTNGTPSGTCSGGCAYFFGAPLPLSSGGVPVCVQNRVTGTITGTANPDTGSGSSTTALISSVFTGLLVDKPCPTCSGASFGSTGTCSDGPRAGQSCTVDGTSQFFGNTSFDCPPNAGANIGNLNIALNPTTGTSTLNPSASTACDTFPFIGTDCFCPQQDKANDCTDGVCTADATGEGECASGPTQGFCQPREPFRSCNNDGECPASGDSCVFGLRKCGGQSVLNAGPPLSIDVTGPITRTGVANVNNPVLVSTFCIGAVSASAVNQAAGLPGPGALRLPSRSCFDATCTFP